MIVFERIVPAAADGSVVSTITIQPAIAGLLTGIEQIIADPTGQRRRSATGQRVIAIFTGEIVSRGARTAMQPVIAASAVLGVRACVADDRIIARVAEKLVTAIAASNAVAAEAAVNGIISGISRDGIVVDRAVQHFAGWRSRYHQTGRVRRIAGGEVGRRQIARTMTIDLQHGMKHRPTTAAVDIGLEQHIARPVLDKLEISLRKRIAAGRQAGEPRDESADIEQVAANTRCKIGDLIGKVIG